MNGKVMNQLDKCRRNKVNYELQITRHNENDNPGAVPDGFGSGI